MDVQILDIVETRTESNDDRLIVFGKNSHGVPIRFHVKDTPHSIYVAVSDSFTENDAVHVCELVTRRLSNSSQLCRRTHCSCRDPNSTKIYDIYREPCGKNFSHCNSFIRSCSIVHLNGGYEIYEHGKRPFMQVELLRASDIFRIAEVFDSIEHSYGGVKREFRGVYGVSFTGVDSFVQLKKISSFEWVSVPKDEPVLCFNEITPLNIQPTQHAPWSVFFWGVSSCHLLDSPVLAISTQFNGNAMTFILSNDAVKDEDNTRLFYDSERELLQAFYRYFMECDPDFVSGFDTHDNDLPYIIHRASRCGIVGFSKMTRMPGEEIIFKPYHRRSESRDVMIVDCPGRIFIDMYTTCRDSIELGRYRIEDIAAYYGLDFCASFDSIKQCIQTVDLTASIWNEQNVLFNHIARCRILRVTVRDSVDKPKTILYALKIRASIHGQYVLPYISWKKKKILRPCYEHVNGYKELFTNAIEGQPYEGGYVQEPIIGRHTSPVATFDFASLYPSIIIALNICHTTLVPQGSIPIEMVNVTRCGFWFIKAEYKKGILPQILEELIAERTVVKLKITNMMDTLGGRDPSSIESTLLRQWNALQYEIKLCSNSFYGQLGTPYSHFSLICGAISITQEGKFRIQQVRDAVLANAEFAHLGLQSCYGDTDSFMLKYCNLNHVNDSIPYSKRIASWINTESGLLLPPMRIVHETTSRDTIFHAKKKCVMAIVDEHGRITIKKTGIGGRDMNRYSSETIHRMFEMAMIEGKCAEDVQDYIRQRRELLLTRQLMDISGLYYSYDIKMPIEDYTNTQVHIVAAKQLVAIGKKVRVGDRIGVYTVITHGSSEPCAIPVELFTANHILDMEYYAQKLMKSIETFSGHLFPGPGTHMRIMTRTANEGQLTSFRAITTKKVKQCTMSSIFGTKKE